MTDIPQPSAEPYSTGDTVRVYIGPDDPDSRFHGAVCVVETVIEDELDRETRRELDRLTYRVKRVETGEVLPVDFRHSDLVPDR